MTSASDHVDLAMILRKIGPAERHDSDGGVVKMLSGVFEIFIGWVFLSIGLGKQRVSKNDLDNTLFVKRWGKLFCLIGPLIAIHGVIVIISAGCTRSRVPPAEVKNASSQPTLDDLKASLDNLKVNGIRYELPLSGSETDRALEFNLATRDNGISWIGVDHQLQVADGEISLDGRQYGQARAGDFVKLTSDGILTVNGEVREPLK